ncbi:MAG TPA: TA system VapC family ribonuclease toxin [Allosphingosinicella sp.]
MTYLLDVNVILALIDPHHVFHQLAHKWFAAEGQASWATCPLTENGAIRILGHARYPEGPGRPAAAATLVAGLRNHAGHQFWGDGISLFSADHVTIALVATAAQVTDTYLLALAVSRGGRLATLDRRLSPAAVQGGSQALVVIG